MMHDMAFSRNYAILLDFPYLFRLSNIMNGKSPLGMADDEPARIGLLPRDASDASQLRWFDIESPCFAFHVANSWEDGDNVHVIACRSARLNMERLSDDVDPTKTSKARKGAVLYEWVFNTADGSVKERTLVDIFGEFPVCDEQNRWGYKTRYVWYGGQGGGHFNKLIKVDLFDNNQTKSSNCQRDMSTTNLSLSTPTKCNTRAIMIRAAMPSRPTMAVFCSAFATIRRATRAICSSSTRPL
eukprot:TRINITY_DN695_c0_g1_i3.p1 TRINITY_DN695_c0_g1~~TRINITY_DN695_c0_g1_i3.p1  ORF type:complete len:242 (+),score=78.52 TRINITY_DN695_c0_g1_i3:765-1490(+)